MRRLIFLGVAGLLAVCSVGCGTTVGDPCTTTRECGDGLCLNTDYTPGGYCTTECQLGVDGSCPAGSRCVEDALDGDRPGCLLECGGDGDCRTGYVCRRVKDHPFTVCIGPEGL